MPSSARIYSTTLYEEAKRLDASFYCGPGQGECLTFLQSKMKKKELYELTLGGQQGIFIPSRFKRVFVNSKKTGYPYLTGAGITQNDPLNNCKFLSRKYTRNVHKLLLKPKMVVVTCSGIIGNPVYISEYFMGSLGSPDLLRIVPDVNKILPGYLFAFLSTTLGRALISRNTYGSVIPHIEAHHIYSTPVPVLENNIMMEINSFIIAANFERDKFYNTKDRFINKLFNELKIPLNNIEVFNSFSTRSVTSSQLIEVNRFKADYFSEIAKKIEDMIQKYKHILSRLGDVTFRIFKPPIFKRHRIEHKNGIPFMGQAEPYQLNPKPKYYLSHKQPLIQEFLLRKGMVIFPAAGSTDGNFGRPLIVLDRLSGIFCGDDLMRIEAKNVNDAGYIYAYLSSSIGEVLIKRLNYGSAIPRIVPEMVSTIPIIWPNRDLRHFIGRGIIDAFSNFERAAELEDTAIGLIQKELSKWLD
ncbi:hypothetical protein [Desulfoferrobacter suflitae]|uniref:hypothetical protein n=1 Tax=Desulfoferrobacter suflitae TaxID=2865782 RepID=UPI0021640B03|nr:hypothetical protein [Desulfoferrobacter suflitae]MCK8603798.1 hypothetical protein [Desulfoferrobacter suflitae]